jgi:hypothetical protein
MKKQKKRKDSDKMSLETAHRMFYGLLEDVETFEDMKKQVAFIFALERVG